MNSHRLLSLFSFLFLFSILSLIMTGPTHARMIASDALSQEMMQWATRQTVLDTGIECICLGSWQTGVKYKGPFSGGLSDHDIRLVMADGLSEKEMMALWKEFQTSLRKNIAAAAKDPAFRIRIEKFEFNKSITGMLEKATNVYPPNQVMATVDTAEEAADLMRQYDAKSPNLADEPVEGVFGQGSKGYKQKYESEAARHLYIDRKTGRLVSGSVDIEHMQSGLERLTVKGQANMASQWREKVLDHLHRAELDKVQKQTKRLRDALKKGRALSGTGGSPPFLDAIADGLTTDPEAIRIAMTKAQQEERILVKLADETLPRNQAFLRNLIDQADGRWTGMSKAFWKYLDKVPFDTLFRAFAATMAYWAMQDLSVTAAESGAAEAAREAYPVILGAVAPVPGLMADLGAAVLMTARDGAYGIVTRYQDCDDLMAGLHTVKGREDAEARGMTIEQMASRFPDTEEGRRKLSSFIQLQATQAASRLEGGQWVADPQIARRLVGKCEPQITRMWIERRQAKIEEFNILFQQYENLLESDEARITVHPEASPLPLDAVVGSEQPSVEVRIQGSSLVDRAALEAHFAKLAALARSLEGGQREVLHQSLFYKMDVDGVPVEALPGRETRTAYRYQRPGEHTVHLEKRVHLTQTIVSRDFETSTKLGHIRAATGRAVVRFRSSRSRLVFAVDDAALCIAGKEKIRLGEKTDLKALDPGEGACEQGVERPELTYLWMDETTGVTFPARRSTLAFLGEHTATYRIKVEAFDERQGKRVRVGTAAHSLEVGTKIGIEAPESALVGEQVRFRALVDMAAAETRAAPLLYAWRYKGSPQVFANRENFTSRLEREGTYEIEVQVSQRLGEQTVEVGRALHTLVVERATVAIEGPQQALVNQRIDHTARVTRGRPPAPGSAPAPPLLFEWTIDGARQGEAGPVHSLAFAAGGSHVLKVIAYEAAGRERKKLGEAEISILVQQESRPETTLLRAGAIGRSCGGYDGGAGVAVDPEASYVIPYTGPILSLAPVDALPGELRALAGRTQSFYTACPHGHCSLSVQGKDNQIVSVSYAYDYWARPPYRYRYPDPAKKGAHLDGNLSYGLSIGRNWDGYHNPHQQLDSFLRQTRKPSDSVVEKSVSPECTRQVTLCHNRSPEMDRLAEMQPKDYNGFVRVARERSGRILAIEKVGEWFRGGGGEAWQRCNPIGKKVEFNLNLYVSGVQVSAGFQFEGSEADFESVKPLWGQLKKAAYEAVARIPRGKGGEVRIPVRPSGRNKDLGSPGD